MTDSSRGFEISTFIGPCSDDEAEALMHAIIELPEFKSVHGGAIGLSPWNEDEPDPRAEVVRLRDALRRAEKDMTAVAIEGWDSNRRRTAQLALGRIEAALGGHGSAVPVDGGKPNV